MSTSLHGMLTGSFTSDGLARFVALPSGYDHFELHNITDLAVPAAANTNVMHARGFSLMPAGTGYVSLKTNGAATVALEVPLATTGFTFVADRGDQTPGAAVAVTAITAASPAVVSSASTAVVGDVLRLTGTNPSLTCQLLGSLLLQPPDLQELYLSIHGFTQHIDGLLPLLLAIQLLSLLTLPMRIPLGKR
jgi:hypothetical protein